MKASRIETVIQFVSDQQASGRWYARLLGIEPTPYPVTLLDPDGNIAGLIDNSKGGIPGQRA